MSNKKRIVLKFGGSVIHSQKDFAAITSEIQRFVLDGFQVIAVVSAYFGVTERLIAKAAKQGLKQSSARYAELVSSGEFESGADLTAHLVEQGIGSSFHAPAEFDFVATGARESASPSSINPDKISAALQACSVLVMPGFSAVDLNGDSILLGRGGSDISAVVVAEALGLDTVRLLKDVDGIYDADPNQFADARRLEHVDYDRACEIGSVLIQPEAIRFAASKNVGIDIAAIGNSFASRIGAKRSHNEHSLLATQPIFGEDLKGAA